MRSHLWWVPLRSLIFICPRAQPFLNAFSFETNCSRSSPCACRDVWGVWLHVLIAPTRLRVWIVNASLDSSWDSYLNVAKCSGVCFFALFAEPYLRTNFPRPWGMAKIGSPSCSARRLQHTVGAAASQACRVPGEPGGSETDGGTKGSAAFDFPCSAL